MKNVVNFLNSTQSFESGHFNFADCDWYFSLDCLKETKKEVETKYLSFFLFFQEYRFIEMANKRRI